MSSSFCMLSSGLILVHDLNSILFFFSAAADQAFIISIMRKLENYVAINNVRCVQFRPKEPTDTYYITIVDGADCSSPVCTSVQINCIFYSISVILGWTKYWRCFITNTRMHQYWCDHARILTYVRFLSRAITT